MPAPGIPYGRTALPTKTVDDAEYTSLAERMSQDYFRLGASHRAEQDAQSLASLIQVPDSGGVTGTTGYEGMLQPEPETSPATPVSDSQGFGDTSVGDTAPRRMALQAMPAMPDLLSPSPRLPLSQQQGQSVDLPGTPESAPQSISFPGSGGGAPAQAIPVGGGGPPSSPAARGPAPAPGGDLHAYARAVASQHGIDPNIFERQIQQESGFNPKAQSPAGAQGIAQFMPQTAKGVGLVDPFEPYSALSAAAGHMADNLANNGGDYARALAAYNAGQGAVNTHGGVPPFAETQRYVSTILGDTRPTWSGVPGPPTAGEPGGPPLAAGPVLASPSVTQRASEARAGERGGLDTQTITQAYQGVPYVFGGAGGRSDPRLGAATDCSGFVASVWKNQYGLDLAAHTDTSYNQLKALGAHDVAEADARPGDVVYYMGAGTGGAITHHMGIYAGPGKVLDMSVSGGDGVRTRDIGHAGRHVILRDPRVNPEMPKQPLTPPPIVPSADSGGAPVSRADADALSLAALSDPSTGAEDLRMAQMPTQAYSDVLVGMGPDAQPAAAPPVRDDYRNEAVQPIDPDQGPRELGYSLPSAQPAAAPAEQPGLLQGIGQGLWDAGASAVGAVQGAAGAVTDAAGRAVGAVQGAVVYPERSRGAVPPEQRPPQYSGPSYAQPTREQAGMAPVEPWEPIQNVGATIVDAAAASAEAADRSLTGPTLPAPTWDDPLAPVRAVGQHIVQQPLSVLPAAIYGDVQGAGADVIGRRAGAAAGLSDEKQPYETPLGTFDLSQQDLAGLAAQIGLDPMNFVGVPAAAKARGLVRALVEAVPGIGELLAVGDIATAGIRAARARVGPAIGRALADNAQNVAAADARMAAQGSTAAPGVFGLSGIEPDLPAVQGMRPRIIPPDVADSLDLPIRLPEDPRIIRAIEAAGGTVDERGTTLNVIRNQGPEAAGGTATRGMTYHIAGPPGTPNPFAQGGDIGGSVRFEGPTRFRNPLFIQQEGGTGHLDDALAKLGVQHVPDPAPRLRLEAGLEKARADLEAGVRRGNHPDWVAQQETLIRRFEREVQRAQAEAPRPVGGRREIDEQVNAIRRRTEHGSPERTAALEELVARYGGDPSVVPELVRLRPGETESGYAIVENIIAENARKHGHDGVIYLGKGIADAAAVDAHPRVAAANEALQRANAAENAAIAEADRVRAAGRRQGDPEYDAAWQRYEHASQRSREAMNETYAAERAARAELEPRTIEELGDPREARNPTPGGTDQARIDEIRARGRAAMADLGEVESRLYAPSATETERAAARTERDQALAAIRSIQDEMDAVLAAPPRPPGYTLRPDIPRRPERLPEGFTVEQLPDGSGRWVLENDAGDWLHERTFPSAAEAQAYGASQAAAPTRGPGSAIAQASAGALAPPVTRRDPFALATRAISEPLAGSIGGATIGGGLPAESDEERRANALRGALIGAGGFPAATRLARGAARLAGAAARGGGALATAGGLPPVPPPRGPTPPAATPGLLAQFPGVQGALQASAQRAAAMQARGLTKPSAVEWLKQLGFSGIFGPATGTGQVIGGALEVAGAQPKEALRALTTGQGGRYGSQVAEQMRALPEAWDGFWDVVLGRRGAAGTAAASGGTQQGTAKLSERVVNPLEHAAARVMEKSGEIWAEAPDAIFRPIFTAQGMRREADRIAQELGQGKAHADTLLAEAKQLHKHPGSAASPEAQRIVDAGQAYADELGYKGDPGKAASWLAKQSQRNDAVGLAAAYAIPFPGMAGRTTRAALRVTPGVGLLPGVRAGRPMLGFDTIHDQAVGAVALAGFGTYAANGGITGSGPADPEKRKQMISEGWQPNSVLVPSPLGTFYVPNRLFQRFGPILNAVGEVHDTVAYQKEGQPKTEQLNDAMKRMGAILTDQTGLSGLSDIYDLLFGQAGFASQAPGTLGRAITRYTPFGGTVRAAAQATDPEGLARKPETWPQLEGQHESGWPGTAAALGEAVGQQLEQNIPGLRGNVAPAQDVLGRPMPNPQQGLGAVVPRITTVRDNPIISTYQAAGVDIMPPAREITGVPLTPREQERLHTLTGQAIIELTPRFTSSPSYVSAPKEHQAELLRDAQSAAREVAQARMIAEMPDFRERLRAETLRAVGR